MTQTTRTLALYKYTVLSLFILALLSVGAYLTFTVATIFATAERTASIKEGKVLTAQIGSMERSFFGIEKGITAAEAQRRGFSTPTKVTFTEMQSGPTLSLNLSARYDSQ